MSIVILQLPDVKAESGRASQCPVCKGEILQRWGGRDRQVRDPQVGLVKVYRYRCWRCRHTFRNYPQGVDQAQQSQRLRNLAALCWTLGLSYRGIAGVFATFGVRISRMTAWRDAQEQAGHLKRSRLWKPVRVLGLDGAYVRAWGGIRPVLVAVDLGEGKPVGIGYVDEANPQAVRRWLDPLVKRLGVSVIVTDDLFSYKSVAERLDLEHQICQFHVRRWVGRTLKELHQSVPGEWQGVVEQTRQLIAELPADGSKRLFELWKQIPENRSGRMGQPLSALDQLRQLLLRLSEHWPHFRVFDWQTDVPWTNNGTEQVIGRMKMRSRTVRGYKTETGLLAGLMLAGTGIR
ncbi:MAG TPA: transposase [Anaerolineales bacterium]